MSILKVCRLGHPVLRMEARKLSAKALASPKIQTLIDDMMVTMVEYYGVGLAAPQIHESLALVGSSRVDLQACKLEYSIVSPK